MQKADAEAVLTLDQPLNVFGQQPGLKLYTQICLCFKLIDNFEMQEIQFSLWQGMKRLTQAFPWLAGQVVNVGAREGHSGVFKIVPLEKFPRMSSPALIHDPSAPSYEDLKQANFPFRMLDESVVAPCKTIPEGGEQIFPIFLLQSTFVKGGLLLTFAGQHQVMDMTGQGHLISLFSKACRNESFTDGEIATGNLMRADVIPLLENASASNLKSRLEFQVVKPVTPAENSPPPPKCSWAYFVFSPDSLAALKERATESITMLADFLSTDDALSAFIWQSVTRARLPRLGSSVDSTFARAVDVRRFLNIPDTYPGLMQNMTYHNVPIHDVVNLPLGDIASQLRSAVDLETSSLGYKTQALATLLDLSPDKNIANFTATINQSKDLMLSSWAKLDCYQLEFFIGTVAYQSRLTKPEAVRRPQFDPVESLVYLMPKKEDGEIAVGICLRDEDMERLKVDEEFVEFCKYVP